MAEREQPRALVLLRVVADGLRDPIRHVKYPDEERCARCGGKWPCPNGAFDELREEIKRLVALQRQLQQAQGELRQAQTAHLRSLDAVESLRQSLTQLQPDFEECKDERDAAQAQIGDMAVELTDMRRERDAAEALARQIVERAGGALEIAANDLEALYADKHEGWMPSEGELAPWEQARRAIDSLYAMLTPAEAQAQREESNG